MISNFSGHPCFLSALNHLADFTKGSRNLNKAVLNQITLVLSLLPPLDFGCKSPTRRCRIVSCWLFQLKYLAHLMYVRLLMKNNTTVLSQPANFTYVTTFYWMRHIHREKKNQLILKYYLRIKLYFFPNLLWPKFCYGQKYNITNGSSNSLLIQLKQKLLLVQLKWNLYIRNP